jgi:N utilization substance protein B
MGRRLARELALKILYRYEEGDADLMGCIKKLLTSKKYDENVTSFCEKLVATTAEHKQEIDARIIEVIENWSYDRVSLIDKIVLRLGVCELLFLKDIPPQVAINEAIEVVKKYGGDNSGRFVNGILDAVKKRHESRSDQ